MDARLTLPELSGKVDACPVYHLPRLMEGLRADRRRGAQRLAERASRRWQRHLRAWLEFQERFALERELWARGFTRIAGVDEVGRGPLAGPVVAAAVILHPRTSLPGLNDSKQLDVQTREELDRRLRGGHALAWAIGVATEAEIDRLNIFHAAQLAMWRAVIKLDPPPEFLLVDGVPLRRARLPQQAIVGGDRRSNSIAAASVIAKVYRDRLMTAMDARFPGYGFAQHKGYPTPAHRQALQRLGPSPIHRKSFVSRYLEPPGLAR